VLVVVCWYLYGVCMVFVWCLYGVCMVFVWCLYGVCMVFVWYVLLGGLCVCSSLIFFVRQEDYSFEVRKKKDTERGRCKKWFLCICSVFVQMFF